MFSVTSKWEKKGGNIWAKKTKAEKVKAKLDFFQGGTLLVIGKVGFGLLLGTLLLTRVFTVHELFFAFLTPLGRVQTSKFFMCRIQHKGQKSIVFPHLH